MCFLILALFMAFLCGCDGYTFFDVMEEDSDGGPLRISPISVTLLVDSQCTFSATGGKPPYSFSIVSGDGSIKTSSGIYTAPSSPGHDTVQVKDDEGATQEAKTIYIE